MDTLRVPLGIGFIQMPAKQGGAQTVYLQKPGVSNEYSIGEQTCISGVCYYQLLSSAGVVCGVLFHSPKVHTVVTPVVLKIGQCLGPLTVNQNLQQVGVLIYESPDSSVLIVPTTVSSPLLIEVDT